MKDNAMRHLLILTLTSVQLFCAGSNDSGFNPFHPDAVGGQFVGTRQDASQIPGSGIGPGIMVFFRYDLSPRILLDFSTGVTTATDDIFGSQMAKSVLFPNFTLRTNYKVLKDAKMTPILYLGLMSTQVSRTEEVYNLPKSEMKFSEYGFMVGSGLIYKSYYNFSITLNADYRYALFSTNDSKSQYWVFESGLSFPLGLDRPEENYVDEIFIPQDENEVEPQIFEPQPPPLNDDFAAFLYKVENLLDRIENKQKQLEDLQARVIANEKAIATVTGFVASEFVNYTDVLSDEQNPTENQDYMAIYQNALASYNNSNYNQAIRLFEQLLYMNKNHPLASNSQYWIGESYHSQQDYGNAAAAFGSVLQYKLSSKYDDALLMNGICQLELGNQSLAKQYFSELVTEFPDSEFVPKANNYLQTL